MEIKEIKDIDNTLFDFKSSISLPPMALSINGRYYQISAFNEKIESFICLGEFTPLDALEKVCSIYPDKSFLTYARVADICKKLDISFEEVSIFQEKGLKGRKTFDTLINSLNLPDNLLSYIDRKDISLKLVSIILAQEKNVISFIGSYLEKEEPSNQAFRNFVEKVADFKEIIPDKYDETFTFPDRLSKSHREVNEAYFNLSKKLSGIKAVNIDSFESPKLTISFDILSCDDYEKSVSILEENKEEIEKFYNLLKEKGLK